MQNNQLAQFIYVYEFDTIVNIKTITILSRCVYNNFLNRLMLNKSFFRFLLEL